MNEITMSLIAPHNDSFTGLDCAMTGYGHAELVSASCGLNPSPAFQAPSPQVARGKIRRIF